MSGAKQTTVTLIGCNDRAQSESALVAAWGYISHPEYPQHQRAGFRNGGGARIGDTYFWVWRTSKGWSVARHGSDDA